MYKFFFFAKISCHRGHKLNCSDADVAGYKTFGRKDGNDSRSLFHGNLKKPQQLNINQE